MGALEIIIYISSITEKFKAEKELEILAMD